MVYMHMTRKCIYTDKEARAKDSVIPKHLLGEEAHNWSSQVPVNVDYKSQKQDRLPNENELMAHEYFHLLELAKLRVKYYEAKLTEVQAEILKTYKEPDKSKPTVAEKQKDKEIKQAIVQKEILEETTKNMDEFFANKRKIWSEDE